METIKTNKKVGSAPGVDSVKRGSQVGKARKKGKKPGKGNQAGNEAGEEYYEVEITLEELAAYLFDSLELPDLEKKKLKSVLSEKFKRHGYRNEGIRPRLDKKETVKKKIRRRKAAVRAGTYDVEGDERFTFHENDLRYRHIKKTKKEVSNAVIMFIMDISGSMTKQKKFLARSFFFLLYQFIHHKYEHTEIVFVAHDTNAYECNEEQFFSRGSGGGTIVSSGLEMVCDIILKRYHPSNWNVYTFHCSDGDNWPVDMEKSIDLSIKIKNMCQLYGYCEIEPEDERLKWAKEKDTQLSSAYSHLEDGAFKISHIHEKADIWPAFKNFFGGKLGA